MAVRVVVLLGLALVIGVGTVIFAQKWIASQTPAAPTVNTEVVEVVPDLFVLVAQGNLQPGMLLGPESFRWQGWPTEDVPPTYVVQGKRDQSEFMGAVVRFPMSAGEPITDFKVAKPGQQGFLAAVLDPGMRAVSVPISAIRASSGFILPGDRVDVLLTHDTGIGTVSETVFFDMKVLAIDQALSNPEGGARLGATATLQVTPREVEAFVLMQQMGTLTLALRSLEPENAQVASFETDEQSELDEMLGTPAAKPMAEAGSEPGMEAMPEAGAVATADADADADAALMMSEKPEVIEKVPTVYPGEGPEGTSVADGGAPPPPVESVENAVGQMLGGLTEEELDEHSIRLQDQTFTSQQDVSVLLGGTGSVVVIRGN